MRQDLNRARLAAVARALGNLREEVVFLGGSIAGMLLSDPAAAPPRPTLDVDVVVEVTSRMELRKLENTLLKLGFLQDRSEGAPICRWIIQGILVDVMPTDASLLGFGNRWYDPGMKASTRLILEEDLEIRVVSAPYFVATKLEAFRGRGEGKIRSSHDLEDVIAVADGRPELLSEVAASGPAVRGFLASEFTALLADSDFGDAVRGYLLPDAASQGRWAALMETLTALAGGDQDSRPTQRRRR